jgi:TM2 domain-containing membrane protein YozV
MSDNPAGWKPDPRGRHEYRYWDGTQWTDHVSDQGEVSQDPVADAAPPTDIEKSAIFTPEETAVTPTAESAGPPATSEPPVTAEPPAAAEPTVTEPTAAEPVTPAPAETTPEPVVAEPVPTATSAAASAGPPGAGATTPPTATTTTPSTAQTDAKAAAQEVLHSKSPELATILSAVIPGSGHFYMGSKNTGLAAGLLVATVAALVLSWMNFLLFIVGFVIWLAAAAFALNDLRGGVRGLENTTLPKNVIAILLIGAGALLIISMLLPYYHLKFSANAGGQSFSQGGNASGFQSFQIIDIILLIVGIASILAGAAALGLGPISSGELPRWLPTAVAVGGAIAVLLILFRMFVRPDFGADGVSLGDVTGLAKANGIDTDTDVGRGFGIWFGLWAALTLVIANAGVLRSLAGNRR